MSFDDPQSLIKSVWKVLQKSEDVIAWLLLDKRDDKLVFMTSQVAKQPNSERFVPLLAHRNSCIEPTLPAIQKLWNSINWDVV